MSLPTWRQLFSASALFLGCASANAQQSTLPVLPLNIGLYVIQAEVAVTAVQRERGLMSRKSMPQNAGMLFDLGRPALLQCMWMKDTVMPLSVAFIDDAGKIINVEDMKPMTEDQHCSTRGAHVRYALETNFGWFAQKHIGPGAEIQGLPNSR